MNTLRRLQDEEAARRGGSKTRRLQDEEAARRGGSKTRRLQDEDPARGKNVCVLEIGKSFERVSMKVLRWQRWKKGI